MIFFVYLIILFSCSDCIAIYEICKLGEMIRYRWWLLPCEVTVLCVCIYIYIYCLEQLMKSITSQIIHYSGFKMIFLFLE